MGQCFKGKRILVTGACQGIGRGIAIELWKQGADVVALSNNKSNLIKLQAEYPLIEIVHVDLTDWDETRKLLENCGAFHGLVNNAGIVITEPFMECSLQSFDVIWQVNVKAVLNVSQTIAKKMVEQKIGGSIVNISSQASKAALSDHVAYCASKAAVDSMTRVMALELGPYDIRVNTVNPTVVMTDLGKLAWSDPVKSKAMLDKIPLGRFGQVEDVVNAVLYLLSDASTMITGTHLPVDGGFLAT